jgi:hypothetical protein
MEVLVAKAPKSFFGGSQMKWDKKDAAGRTPLMIAALNDNKFMCK